MCEDGATVAATPTFLHSGQSGGPFVGQNGQRLHGNILTGKPHKIPQMSYLRHETRNAGDFSIQLIGPPKQMKQQMRLKDADESENRLTKHKK